MHRHWLIQCLALTLVIFGSMMSLDGDLRWLDITVVVLTVGMIARALVPAGVLPRFLARSRLPK